MMFKFTKTVFNFIRVACISQMTNCFQLLNPLKTQGFTIMVTIGDLERS